MREMSRNTEGKRILEIIAKKIQTRIYFEENQVRKFAKKIEEDLLGWFNLAEKRWLSFAERYRFAFC